jgi:hypothetical protein
MSWAKRNLYFLISGIVAVVLLGAAGWYCYSSMQSNAAVWAQLQEAYGKMDAITKKSPGAGNNDVNNIEAAKEQTKEVEARVAEMRKFFVPVRGIPDTNHFDERRLAFAVRDTVSQLRAAAKDHSVALPMSTPEFAFSFTLQVGKMGYDAGSHEMLSKQLGEVKLICDTLFACRITALDSVQRERTADDASTTYAGGGVSGNDYTDSISLTNGNVVITPYQVTFQCFTPELGRIISSFANQEHTVVVKTLNVQPAETGMMSGDMGGYGGGYGALAAGAGAGGYGGGYGAPPQPAVTAARGLQTVIDEKKLRVTLLLDFVKILPTQGR